MTFLLYNSSTRRHLFPAKVKRTQERFPLDQWPSFYFYYITAPPIDICSMPEDGGLCLASIPRWWYNRVTNQCQSFIYGGCGGNKNNFKTLIECDNRCRRNSWDIFNRWKSRCVLFVSQNCKIKHCRNESLHDTLPVYYYLFWTNNFNTLCKE